ncbi:LysR family transcriptional regulator (plasmid) [Aliisedimentitalea scapharcae]|uniref:LysR family transcriptional regulator n=1 Tax=Aliisedimentitalea scapharcae TaxID=1524259 RepID=A0ABZ2XZI6_9RHOB
MPKFPNLIWLRSFECAARHMNFTAAAAELGITQTALSLHVRSLEAELGCQLFTRAARHLTLTEVGQAYAFSLRRSLGDIALSTTSLFGSSNAQVLTVRAPISTAAFCLAHRLPDFMNSHPGVSIRMVSNIWAESAGRENVDVELRLGIGGWDDVPARKISKERIVPISSRTTGSKTLSVQTLQQGSLVAILGFEDMWHRYLTAFGLQPTDDTPPYAVDTTVAAVDIVAAGGGHALVLERFAASAIAAGRSISIVGDPVPIEQSHFILDGSMPDASGPAKQLFEAWLEAEFA